MADERISEYVEDGTSKPIQPKDLMDFSNDTDGGTTYDVSKKITPEEFATWLLANGFAFTDNAVITGSGTGIQESIMRAGEVFGDPDNLTISLAANFNGTDYNIYIYDVDKTLQLNAPSAAQVIISISNNIKLQAQSGANAGIETAVTIGDRFHIGNTIVAGNDVKLFARGNTDSNGSDVFAVQGLTGAAGVYTFSVTDDGFVKLASGTSVNNISIDGTAIGNSDDTIMTEKATNTLVNSAIAGISPHTPTRLATTTHLDNVGVGVWTSSGSGVGKILTAGSVGILTVDAVNSVLNDRIFIKDEDGSSANLDDIDHGIYEVTTEGTAGVAAVLTRATDFDGDPAGEVKNGSYAFVKEGTVNNSTGWRVTSPDPIVVDTDSISIIQFAAFPVGSKIVFFDKQFGSTLNPTTTNTTSATATIIPQTSITFTPSAANSLIEYDFKGNFSNNKDNNAICGVFIDDGLGGGPVFQSETVGKTYVGAAAPFHGQVIVSWEGSLPMIEHTIHVGMWTTGDTLTSIEDERVTKTKETIL